jgi:hypothetical protein
LPEQLELGAVVGAIDGQDGVVDERAEQLLAVAIGRCPGGPDAPAVDEMVGGAVSAASADMVARNRTHIRLDS